MSVLVLNASYEPLHVVSRRRAIVLVLKDKAQLVEATDARIRSERLVLPAPAVIRLVTYVRVPYRWRIPVTRRGILARDAYTCQYCGRRPGRGRLTIDHVVPRSQGGTKTWDNLVAACGPCNHRKGSRRPAQAGMVLQTRPTAPRFVAFAFIDGSSNASWRKYLHPTSAVSGDD